MSNSIELHLLVENNYVSNKAENQGATSNLGTCRGWTLDNYFLPFFGLFCAVFIFNFKYLHGLGQGLGQSWYFKTEEL